MTGHAPDPKAGKLARAVAACREGAWKEGLLLLGELAREDSETRNLPGYFYSYYGHALARCKGRKDEGVELCRHAVRLQPLQPENHLNLAWTLLMAGKRGAAYVALQRGFSFDPSHRGLRLLARRMGVRRRPPIAFLGRDHVLNRLLGSWSYRIRSALAERRKRRAEEAGL